MPDIATLPSRPKHILAVIPATRAVTVRLTDGKVAAYDKIASHADPIDRFFEDLQKDIGKDDLKNMAVVIQSPPWTLNFLKTQRDVLFTRTLTETTIRWVSICELDGTFYAHVGRGRWLKSMTQQPQAVLHNGDLDQHATTRKQLDFHVDEFADAACFAYWYYLVGWQGPQMSRLHDDATELPPRSNRRGASA